MSVHIGANIGDISPAVLLPGDPLRAKFIAENFLEGPVCHNQVRNMLGFTGRYKGKAVSVQGTGMGMPSHHIYVHELIHHYGCRVLIRVGTCGAIQPEIRLREVILAIGASTNSGMNLQRFHGMDFSATADFELLQRAHAVSRERQLPVRVGTILSSDTFYDDDPESWKLWQKYGVLAIEMETAELYTLAAQAKVRALSLLTVSDQIVSGERASSEERQTAFTQMVEVALEAAVAFV